MFPSIPSFQLNPFAKVPCPEGGKCVLPSCIFSHAATTAAPAAESLGGRISERIRLEDGPKTSVKPADRRIPKAQPAFVGSIASNKSRAPSNIKTNETAQDIAKSKGKNELPRSATRAITPPPRASVKKTTKESDVPLMQRKLANEPAQFAKRQSMLKVLRQFMGAKNDLITEKASPEVKAMKLTSNQLNKLAVDEEARIGIEHKAVYENILKQRLSAIKKMSLDDWILDRKAAVEKAKGIKPAPPKAITIETGLTAVEEVILLSTMVSHQDGLERHGYVSKLPDERALAEKQKLLVCTDGWEECDRCATRFQVFPDRREEDGALTSGGKCRHHWGRKQFPKRTKGQLSEPATWSCCKDALGSEGCSTHDTHVFKVKPTDAVRLSTIMPFIETPENDKPDVHTAVCFDCEMGYTTQGLELLRLTAVSWPSHKPILDILVRPLGHILDVNTRFSGVTPEKYFNAKPYDPKDPTIDPKDLRIVDSPYEARDVFCSFISPQTFLLGHALENDLTAIRLIHRNFVDTVFLYPHNQGLPLRNGLRNLARNYLQMDIQQGGAAGHDSLEDARATGELVRFKVAENWKKMKREGWTIRSDGVYPPVPGEMPPPPPIPIFVSSDHVAGAKRKLEEDDHDDDETNGVGQPQPKRHK